VGLRRLRVTTLEPERSASVSEAIRRDFSRDGHVLVRGLLTPIEALAYCTVVDEARRRHGPAGLWRFSGQVASFVGSRKFCRVVADLLAADGIRLYHDLALWDRPGDGASPWHQDCACLPLPGSAVVTMWMPLAPLPAGTSGLTFASGSHRGGCLPEVARSESGLSQESDRALQSWRWPRVSYCDIRPGDATFHLGTVLHSAAGNPRTSMSVRQVIEVIYFVDGVRALPPRNQQHETELTERLPGVSPGEVAASDLNPLVFSRF
jgi:ectoine hydroxylase-related dioxygenase (phytanoyl-CoA dioxygenase family)